MENIRARRSWPHWPDTLFESVVICLSDSFRFGFHGTHFQLVVFVEHTGVNREGGYSLPDGESDGEALDATGQCSIIAQLNRTRQCITLFIRSLQADPYGNCRYNAWNSKPMCIFPTVVRNRRKNAGLLRHLKTSSKDGVESLSPFFRTHA